MKVRIKMLIICLFIANCLFSADVDVNLTIPEDYGIDFPSALHLDRLYFAVEGENGNLELLTENDLNIGIATRTFGSVDLCLLYYGNLSKPYTVQLVVDAGDGFILMDSTQGEFTIPISPVISFSLIQASITKSSALSQSSAARVQYCVVSKKEHPSVCSAVFEAT